MPALIPGTCEYATLHSKRDLTGDQIRTWRWEISLDCPGGSNVIKWILKSARHRQKSVRKSEKGKVTTEAGPERC